MLQDATGGAGVSVGPCLRPQRLALCPAATSRKPPTMVQCLGANAQPAGMWVHTSLHANVLVMCICRCIPVRAS